MVFGLSRNEAIPHVASATMECRLVRGGEPEPFQELPPKGGVFRINKADVLRDLVGSEHDPIRE